MAFLSQKKRSKQDLDERLERIISTASALQRSSSGTDGAQIPRELVKTCTELLKKGPANTVDAKHQFLIEIATNRQSPKYASAFLGGALTFQEIATIDESRALNSNIEKISPASVEGASVVHAAKKIISSHMVCCLSQLEKSKYLIIVGIVSARNVSQSRPTSFNADFRICFAWLQFVQARPNWRQPRALLKTQ